MKTSAFFVTASLVAFPSLINMAIAQSYFASCDDAYTLSGSVMSYSCRAENGLYVSGSIDLGQCISNRNGNLVHGGSLVYPNTALDTTVMQCVLKIVLYIADLRKVATNAL